MTGLWCGHIQMGNWVEMGSCIRGDRRRKEQYPNHSGPCKPTLTSLSSWLMGSILVVLDSTNYNRKIESLLADRLVGGWPRIIEIDECTTAVLKRPSVAEEVCQQLPLKSSRYPKLNRLHKIHKDGEAPEVCLQHAGPTYQLSRSVVGMLTPFVQDVTEFVYMLYSVVLTKEYHV